MASSLLVALFLLSSYTVVLVRSSRPIADNEVDQTNWSAAEVATATVKADGGHRRGVVARYLVAERSIGGMVASREPAIMVRRSPWKPPSPIGHVPVAWEKGKPPCLGVGCSQIKG
ncbi:hypothetical protein DAI22_06g056200 [Oryza sativa Japonica Group]|nr:hypothetical protein DAI22_06g056200 [Oryza sativa Japonica Group]